MWYVHETTPQNECKLHLQTCTSNIKSTRVERGTGSQEKRGTSSFGAAGQRPQVPAKGTATSQQPVRDRRGRSSQGGPGQRRGARARLGALCLGCEVRKAEARPGPEPPRPRAPAPAPAAAPRLAPATPPREPGRTPRLPYPGGGRSRSVCLRLSPVREPTHLGRLSEERPRLTL